MAKSKLSEHDKSRIGQLYFEDHKSQTKIAKLYDVSQSTIHDVIKEQNYLYQIAKRDNQINEIAKYGAKEAAKAHISQTKTSPDAIRIIPIDSKN